MKPWGGRFRKGTNKQVEEFTASLSFDKRLYRQDIAGSIAHAKMLANSNIITQEDADAICSGLSEIFREVESGDFNFQVGDEDIHMAIERALIDKVGPVGGKLHTARSRNDQVALDTRIYAKEACVEIAGATIELQRALLGFAKEHQSVIMPGYTHMQRAQPVLLTHHLLAYFFMTLRDFRRFSDCYREADSMPLGSGALAGAGFDIDRGFLAKELGFATVTDNSMDSVSDRDFVVQLLAAVALVMTHLSRLSEEVVLWSSSEFGYLVLDDSYSTGSSMMPQKKNPDVAELVRGKCGRVFGDLMAMLTILKGLPLTYNRDLQEDKECLFDAIDTALSSLRVFAGMLSTAKVNASAMTAAAGGGYSTATDYADYLVEKGVPFRSAHEVVGRIVGDCIAKTRDLSSLSPAELHKYSTKFEEDALLLADVPGSLERRRSEGGSSPESVKKQLAKAEQMVAEEEAWVEQHR